MKSIKWVLLSIVGIILIAVIILGIMGIPTPPAITTKHIPRLPWKHAMTMYEIMKRGRQAITFDNWSPSGDGMHVLANSGRFGNKLHALQQPMQSPEVLAGIPENATIFFNPNPEKDYLIYAKDKEGDEIWQLYRFDLKTKTSELLTDGTHMHPQPIFEKNGNRIIYITIYQDEGYSEVYSMNPENSMSKKRIVELDMPCVPFAWSPDGKYITIIQHVSLVERNIFLIDLARQTMEQLKLGGDEPANYDGGQWSPDGTRIYYTSDSQAEFETMRFRDLITGKDSVLSGHIPWDVTSFDLSADGKWLSWNANEDGVGRGYLLNTQTGKYMDISGLPFGSTESGRYHAILPFSSMGYGKFHPSQNILALNLYLPSGLPLIFTYDIEKGKLTQWTKPTKEQKTSFPDPELIRYSTFDIDSLTGRRREISAVLYRPKSDVLQPYPVIILIHGGPVAQTRMARSAGIDIMLEQGIAVLAPNVRGSSGYGKSFEKLDNGILREDAVKDIGALLDWVANHPELNEKKVVVFGGSYGGYMALASAVHYSDRLVGAVDLFGISNWLTFLENTFEISLEGRREEYGDEREPEMRKFLEEISPLTHVNKIQVPVLIYQGKNDMRIAPSESRQMADHIRTSGKEVWYIEAANEGHTLSHPLNYIYVGVAGIMFANKCFTEGE